MSLSLRTLFLTSFFTMLANACDPDACNIGTSVAIGTGCAVAGAAVTGLLCAATFGIGCAVGTAATAGICGAVTAGAEYGNKLVLGQNHPYVNSD